MKDVIRNQYFFQFRVTPEQIQYTNRLVNYSISSHPVPDIFQNDPDGKKRQREFRFTGTLGEVLFADAYLLTRPEKSFGAIDGQDFGQDFEFSIIGKDIIVDVKTMHRKHNNLKTNFVLNLPSYQLQRDFSLTTTYFCISLHKESSSSLIASFLGYVHKEEILKGEVGILYKAGTQRIKDDFTSFTFQRDTYEVDFCDIYSPPISDDIKMLNGFRKKTLIVSNK